VSAKAARDALALRAAAIINIKAGRVGGYLEAVRMHDLCREAGIPVWCGGMLETGIGRAANAALAALPDSRCPATSRHPTASTRATSCASRSCWRTGTSVPTAPGIGVEIDPVALEDATVARRRCAADRAEGAGR
jgi:O-succinylbenzoate synthase